jgi:hypothetical protein
MNAEQALQRLARAGVVDQRDGTWHTTPKWERAFMRAEERVLEFNEAIGDPRVAISYALVDVLGAKVPEAELKAMIDAILPLELAEEKELEPGADEGLEDEPEA